VYKFSLCLLQLHFKDRSVDVERKFGCIEKMHIYKNVIQAVGDCLVCGHEVKRRRRFGKSFRLHQPARGWEKARAVLVPTLVVAERDVVTFTLS